MFSSNIFLVGINKLWLNSSAHCEFESQILATWLLESVDSLLNKSKPERLLLTGSLEPPIDWRMLLFNCQTEFTTLIFPSVESAT